MLKKIANWWFLRPFRNCGREGRDGRTLPQVPVLSEAAELAGRAVPASGLGLPAVPCSARALAAAESRSRWEEAELFS